MPKNTTSLKPPIAVYPICNHGGYEILSIIDKPEGYFVELAMNNGETRKPLGSRKVSFANDMPYFKLFGEKLFLNDFMKLG